MSNKQIVRHSPLLGRVSRVSSDGMTLLVVLPYRSSHKLYVKGVANSTEIAVHSDVVGISLGDSVLVRPSRRYSASKSWKCLGIVKGGAQ